MNVHMNKDSKMIKRQNKRKPKSPVQLAGTLNKSTDNKNDSICMSRQLNTKKQTKVKMRKTPLKSRVMKNNLPKRSFPIRPMPTFSDLEKMFEDSEVGASNPESSAANTNILPMNDTLSQKDQEDISNSNTNHPDQNKVSTTERQLIVNNTVETSSNIKSENIRETIDLVYTKPTFSCSDIIIIDDEDISFTNGRKRNRSEQDDSILREDKETAPKIKKKSNKKCELRECDNDSCDSDVTIIYDIEAPLIKETSCSTPSKRFSPLPSTSTDNAIILENDKSFMLSLSESESGLTHKDAQKVQEPEISLIDHEESNQNTKETVSSYTKETHKTEVSEITIIDDDELNQNIPSFTIETHKAEVSEVAIIDDNELKQNVSSFTKETHKAEVTEVAIIDDNELMQNVSSFTKKTHKAEVSEIAIINDDELNKNVSSFTKESHKAEVSEITIIDDYELNQNVSGFTKKTHRAEVSEIFIDDDELNQNISSFTNEIQRKEVSEITVIDQHIDVDALIAENETILTKYKTVENLHAVIDIRPKKNNNQTVNTDNVCQNLSTPCDRNQSTPVIPLRTFNTDINAPRTRKTRPTRNRLPDIIDSSRNSNLTQTMAIDSPHSLSNNSNNHTCPICLETLRCIESASTTCGHIFCMLCIQRALKSSKKCPTCRKNLKAPGYHRLFL